MSQTRRSENSPNPRSSQRITVGVLSDTHGHLSTVAAENLQGVDLIIHAGDIGGADVLDILESIAPTRAVRGNMDSGQWARGLHDSEVVEVGNCLLYVLHDRLRIDLDPSAAGFSVVISGHTHTPSIETGNGVLFLNPGSASWPRSQHAPSIARLDVVGKSVNPQIIYLSPV